MMSHEGPEVEIRKLRESAIRNNGITAPEPEQPLASLSGADTGRYCAYNQTCERFLSTDVEVADFSEAIIEDRLATLTAGSGAALWITPFRGLSPTSLRLPVDLIYLDQSCMVIEVVESFPISHPSSGVPADSVLALPPRTISSVGIQSGDRLFLHTPEDMKRHLRQLQTIKAISPPVPHSRPDSGADLQTDSSTNAAARQVHSWESRVQSQPSGESTSVETPPSVPSASEEPASADRVSKFGKTQRSWWQRLLSDEPPDPRDAEREPLPGLVAYFFTGDTPEAHGVRDISATGLYILTRERWYIGTVVRITLTDYREPTVERSITLNAKVVRWGNDGVGLQFILDLKKPPRRKPPAAEELTGHASRWQVEGFIKRFKGDL